MSAESQVAVVVPVNARELFAAARDAADCTGDWMLRDAPGMDGIHAYYASPGDATVTVLFPAAGGLLPGEEPSPGDPEAYATVEFWTNWFGGEDAVRRSHEVIVTKLIAWLDGRGLRWCRRFEEDPWIHGTAPAARGARS